MVKIIDNGIAKIKNKSAHIYHCIINIPNLYKNKIIQLKNYYHDCKYKFTHLKNTNFNLGIEHLYSGNLNDALLRFNIVNKFGVNNNSSEHLDTDYWLGLTYFLKNNYIKALEHMQKSIAQDKQSIVTFLQNYKNIQEVPQELWQRYRDLIARYYPTIFQKSGSLNTSITILKMESNTRYISKFKPLNLIVLYLNVAKPKMLNNTSPSKNASYNWLGCRGLKKLFGKIVPKLELVTLPYNSPLIKFAILPKNSPIGATVVIISAKPKNRTWCFLQKK